MNIKRKLDQGIEQAKSALAAHKRAIAIAGAVVLAGALGLGAAATSIEPPSAPTATATSNGGAAKKADEAKATAPKDARADAPAAKDGTAKPEDAETGKDGKKQAGSATTKKAAPKTGDAGKKPGHKHAWKDHTTTVETWIIDVVPIYEEHEVLVGYTKKYTEIGIHCNCGQVFLYTDPGYSEKFRDHSVAHILADEPSNYWTEAEWIEDKNLPIYDTERVQVGTEDHSHYETETIVDYRYCDCGARQ